MSNDDASGFPPQPGQPNDGSGFPPAPSYNDPPAAPGQQPPPAPQYGQAPPPPGQAAPAQPAYGQAPPPPGQGYPQQPQGAAPPPPGYVSAGNGGMVKGPRPDVKIGGILVAVGALLSILGVFLPWASGGEGRNGMDDFIFTSDGDLYIAEGPGTIPIVFAVIMLAFGITLILAGRVLAVAILSIIGAVIALFIGLAMIGIASGFADDFSDADLGIGAILQPIAPLLSLAGGIVATSKRRKMVPADGSNAPFYG